MRYRRGVGLTLDIDCACLCLMACGHGYPWQKPLPERAQAWLRWQWRKGRQSTRLKQLEGIKVHTPGGADCE